MNVSQRNGGSVVTVAPSDHYVVDRFKIQDYSDATFTSQQDYDVHDGFTYCSKLTVTGTDTSLGTTQYQRFIQPIEGTNVRHLNWGTSSAKTVTFSFYVNSSLTGTFYVHAFNNAANRSFVSAYTINTANTWEKKTITISGDTSGTWLTTNGVGIYLGFSLGTGTNFQTSTLDAWDGSFKMAGSNQVNLAGTNGAIWKVTGCQLEVGSQASPFEHESYDVTLRKCNRYYQKIEADAGFDYGCVAPAIGSTAAWYVPLPLKTGDMRVDPTLSYSAVGDFRITLQHSSSSTCTSIAIGYNHTDRPMLSVQAGSNSAGSLRMFGFNGASSGWIAFDAEF